MVVPGRGDGRGVAQLHESGLLRELCVPGAKYGHVAGVAIDVVAQEQEELGLRREHRLPDGLLLAAFGTGAESDPREGSVERDVRIWLHGRTARRLPRGPWAR